MRRLLFLLIVALATSRLSVGQVMIDNFDAARPDTTHWMSSESPTVFSLEFDGVDKVEGAGSLKATAKIGAVHPWGTYAQFGYSLPDTVTPWDWSISDSISIWIKVRMAPSIPQNMVLRIHIADRPSPSVPVEEWVYEHLTVVDVAHSNWINLKLPIFERAQNQADDLIPDSTGFIIPPAGWNFTRNNRQLDRDKIVGWSLAFVTSGWNPSGNLPADSMIVSLDKFERVGVRAVPAIVFNGRAFTTNISNTWSWGQSAVSVEQNAGPIPNSNAVKWVQGNEWGNGWTGWGVDITPAFNLAGGWRKDSLKLSVKAEPGVGALRAQFESGPNGKRGMVFTPIADNQWHEYSLALRNFTVQDNAPNFDSSAITQFGVMAEASGIAGKIVYFGKIWTGNPSIDVIPPAAPTGLSVAGTNYLNLITWNDVPNEPNVRYNVFFKETPWTDYQDPTVEDLPPYSSPATLANHPLRSPNTDQNITYYYGVTAMDEAGNQSTATVSATPKTTLAKGVPTISLTAPVNFNANGSLSEWSAITPFTLSVVSGTAHSVPNFPIQDDNDLMVKAYVAVDATYLYIAFDVVDNVVAVDTAGQDYLQDSPDIFIGLYDWRGKKHQGYRGGSTPDYHFRFSKNRVWLDNGGVVVMTPGANYAWREKTLTPGYIVEVRMSWAQIAALLPSRGDAVFVPQEGKRIPIDFAINDRDDASPTGTREGIMCYSTISNDDSWRDMFWWTHTWIGNQWVTSVEQNSETPATYKLGQNYPNPFNPSTKIDYSLAQAGWVTLKVYDMLGREVTTLINRHQQAGSYTVTVDMSNAAQRLSSGVYFYRLESGSFSAVSKMMMLK